jgi:hypothetical protein
MLATLPSGEVVAGGTLTTAEGCPAPYWARWTTAGTAPVIDQQPFDAIVCDTGSIGFGIQSSGGACRTVSWEWQAQDETSWHAMVNGVNSLGAEPQFEAGGSSTASITLTPALNPESVRVWPRPGYRVRAVVTSTCGSVTSDAATLIVCVADYDCNGFTNGDDFDAFASAFDAGDAASDVNHDGFPNGDDFDYFAAHFDAGC